jgi:hypothetical protein
MTTKLDSNRREMRQRKEMGLGGEKKLAANDLLSQHYRVLGRRTIARGHAIDIISVRQKGRII